MASNNEIALEQALVALIGAICTKKLDDKALIDHATALLLGNSTFRWVGHPHVEHAISALSSAHAKALELNS